MQLPFHIASWTRKHKRICTKFSLKEMKNKSSYRIESSYLPNKILEKFITKYLTAHEFLKIAIEERTMRTTRFLLLAFRSHLNILDILCVSATVGSYKINRIIHNLIDKIRILSKGGANMPFVRKNGCFWEDELIDNR